jgi:hypothetical protein
MPEFTTRFEGLVVHADLGTKWVSALISADEHNAVLAVPRTAVSGTPTLPRFATTPTNSEELWFDIAGEMVTSDLPAGIPSKHASFDSGVVHLTSVAETNGAEPRLTADTTAVDPNVFKSLVPLPAGTLFAVDFFSHAARFGTTSTLRCVAQAVELASETQAATVTFSTSKGSVTVQSDQIVRFLNFSPDSVVDLDAVSPTHGEDDEHFSFYGRFFEGDAIAMQTPKTVNNARCNLARNSGQRFSVDCSNTQYP